MTRPLMLATEVAPMLRVPVGRVYELARAGTLPCVRIGRQRRFSPDAIDAYIAAQGTANAERDHESR